MSRRIHKETTALAPPSQGAGETVFHFQGWNLCAEYEVNGASLEILRTCTWGLDLSGSLQGAGGVGGVGGLLAVEEKAGDHLGIHYPLFDGNGNVLGTVKLTSGFASTTSKYEYDAFGNTVYQADGYADEMPFRFSTKYFDKETGFYYYGYRFYDPVTGRWPSRDPIEERGGMNLYGFALNSAVNLVDADGRIVPLVVLAVNVVTYGGAVSNCLVAAFTCRWCYQCKQRASNDIDLAAAHFGSSLELEEWLLKNKPGAECADLCISCGNHLLHAVVWVGGAAVKYGMTYRFLK